MEDTYFIVKEGGISLDYIATSRFLKSLQDFLGQ